jgi:putative transposase
VKARYQYRFYPTDQQKQSLARLFGCVRVVYNDALAICKESEKNPSTPDLQKIVITQAKKTPEREWLKEVCASTLQQSVRDLGVAFKNFFDSCTGKRKGPKVGYPKFKKKESAQSARFVGTNFGVSGDFVYMVGVGNVQPVWSRELPSLPSSVTVIKDCGNRYFLSFVVEVEGPEISAKNQSVGIDLGIKTFATLSTGEFVHGPSYKALDRKVRKLQKQLKRCEKGSNRRKVVALKIAKTHNKIADLRKDFLHKLSTRLVIESQSIILEDLNVSGMVKNRKLSRVISMQGWAAFRSLVEGKAAKFGREFKVISRWEPTSQICSSCGFKWGKLGLGVREVKCLNCGQSHDRDINAAINIQMVGMGHRHDLKCA